MSEPTREKHVINHKSFMEALPMISTQRPDLIPPDFEVKDLWGTKWDTVSGIDYFVTGEYIMNTVGARIHTIFHQNNNNTDYIYKGTTVRVETDFGGNQCELSKERDKYALRPSLSIAVTVVPTTREIVGLGVLHECDRRAFYELIDYNRLMDDYKRGKTKVIKSYGGGLFISIYYSDILTVLGKDTDIYAWYHPKYKHRNSNRDLLKYIKGI